MPDLEQTVEKLKAAKQYWATSSEIQPVLDEAITALTEAQQREQKALAEIWKWLSPENENVKRGDLIAAIRDLAQVAMSETGNSETLEAEVARLTAENAALKKKVQEAGEALRLLGVRLYNGAITPDDLAAMLKEGR